MKEKTLLTIYIPIEVKKKLLRNKPISQFISKLVDLISNEKELHYHRLNEKCLKKIVEVMLDCIKEKKDYSPLKAQDFWLDEAKRLKIIK